MTSTPSSTAELSGRVALVTGGAQGLGRKFAEYLTAAGATVVIADLQDDKGQEVAAAIGGHYVHLDVTDDASWEAAVGSAIEQAGGLDVVVNNAGIEIASLFIDLDPDVVRRILDVNVVGTSLGVKHAFRSMGPGGAAGHADGGGVVINIASVAATIAFPALSAYSASKSAVDRLTRVAAMESGKLGLGIRVNCVCPGLVPNEMGAGLANEMTKLGLFGSPEEAVAGVTELTPSGRLATEDEIADAVVFLASDRSKFINGVALSVDGGMGM